MSLVKSIQRALNRKRGQAALKVKSEPDTRTFLCAKCGYMVRVESSRCARWKGTKIPDEYGCARCDRATWRRVCWEMPAVPNQRREVARMRLARSMGLTTPRVYRAMELALKDIHG